MTPRFLPGIADFSYCLNKWRFRQMKDPAILAEAASLGAKVFQFDFLFNQPEGAEENRAALLRQAKELGVELTAADYGDPTGDRFARQVEVAKAMGLKLVRHACGPFLGIKEPLPESVLVAALKEAAKAYEAAGIRLAIENHQDYTASQFARMLEAVGSPNVGILLDTGNSIALLEDPVETARILAPFTFGVHLKEYVVHPAPLGFDLVGVEMGCGVVDNRRVLEIVAEKAPAGTLPVLMENPIERCRIPVLSEPFLRHLGAEPLASAAPVVALIRRSLELFPDGVTLAFEGGASPEEACAKERAHNRAAFAKVAALLP